MGRYKGPITVNLTDVINDALGFEPSFARIDNATNQFLYLDDIDTFITPGVMGQIIPYSSPLARIRFLTPNGYTALPTVTGQQAKVTFYDKSYPFKALSIAPASVATPVVRTYGPFKAQLAAGAAQTKLFLADGVTDQVIMLHAGYISRVYIVESADIIGGGDIASHAVIAINPVGAPPFFGIDFTVPKARSVGSLPVCYVLAGAGQTDVLPQDNFHFTDYPNMPVVSVGSTNIVTLGVAVKMAMATSLGWNPSGVNQTVSIYMEVTDS